MPSAGQKDGTGAMTNLDDERLRKDDILSNRDKTQRRPDQSLDSTGVQVAEYKDIPTNRRPDAAENPDDRKPDGKEADEGKDEEVDRPGFDLGGSSGETSAGRGLGLGKDAKGGRDDWSVPRKPPAGR